MRAAEKLISERGMENVSIRNIVSAAGQKNESALQYHFKNLTGLIDEILNQRSAQAEARRANLIEALLAHTPDPALRDICMLMVQPAFELARGNVDFRRYVKAFGHELVLTDTSILSKVSTRGGGGLSGKQTSNMLMIALPQLNADAYQRRLEAAVRLCSASMYHQARQKNAFRGDQAELFLHSLVDALVGLFSAPVSPETKALTKTVR
jgi:AcrR family transcriptional regulator